MTACYRLLVVNFTREPAIARARLGWQIGTQPLTALIMLCFADRLVRRPVRS